MTNVFDEIGTKPSQKSEKVAKEFKMFGFTPEAETIEKIRKPLVQKVAYPGTEFLSSLLGAPGDVLSFINQMVAKPLSEKLSGKEGLPYEEMLLGKVLPPSESIHKAVEGYAGEKLRPETTGEELLGTTAGFLGAMYGFGAGGVAKAGRIPFTTKTLPAPIKTVLSAFAPASAFVATQKADLPPWMQAGVTVGVSLLTHKATNKNIGQIKNDLYSLSDKLAKGRIITSDKLISRLDNLQATMSEGLKTGPKTRISSLIEEMTSKASGGVIPVKDLIEFRKDIIEVGKEFTKEQMKGSEKFWKPLRQAVDNSIGDFEKVNPEFSQAFRQANSLHRGMLESKRMETFIKNHKYLFGLAGGAGGLAMKLLGTTFGITPIKGLLAAKAYNFTRAMVRNPGLRKAWKDLLKNAANENLRGTGRALKNFNAQVKKEGLDTKTEKKDIFDEL